MVGVRVAVVLCVVVAALTGAPVVHAAFPGGNGMLAFGHHLTGAGDTVEQTRINADGTGEGLLLQPFVPEVRYTMAVDWSPSGNQIVYERRREWGGAIYRANADGTGETRISPAGVASHNAVWSPDGTKVAYRRYSTSNAASATLWVMNADGSGQAQLVPDGVDADECSAWLGKMDWSSTDRIAFIAACEGGLSGGGWHLWTVAGNGTDLQVVGAVPSMLAYNGGGNGLDWSPDGKKIAFSSFEDYVSGYTVGECGTTAAPYDVYVADVVQNTNTKLTNTSGWAGPHERAPAWSPDGTQIAFAADTYTCTGTTTDYSRRPIYRMPSAGGVPTRVSDPQPRTFLGTDYSTVVSLPTEDDDPDWQPCVPAMTTACISIAAPRNTAPPAITGTPRAGATLTCDPGTWTGSTGLAYRWLRSGTEIPGANAPTYAVRADDVYNSVTCEVTATGPGGTATETSAAVSVIPEPYAPPAADGPRDQIAGNQSQGERQTLPQGSPAAAASVIALPPTRACVSRRAFSIRLRVRPGERVARAVIRVQGRQPLTVTRRLTAAIVLKGMPKGRWTIRVDVTTTRRTLKLTRTYRTCAPKRRAA